MVVAVVARRADGWEIQLWQGSYDVATRQWLSEPKQRACYRDIARKHLAWEIAEGMAADIGCVDIIGKDSN